jgi:hypothetical protein
MTHKCLYVNTLAKETRWLGLKLVSTKRDMSPEFYSGDRLPMLTGQCFLKFEKGGRNFMHIRCFR